MGASQSGQLDDASQARYHSININYAQIILYVKSVNEIIQDVISRFAIEFSKVLLFLFIIYI